MEAESKTDNKIGNSTILFPKTRKVECIPIRKAYFLFQFVNNIIHMVIKCEFLTDPNAMVFIFCGPSDD